MRLFTLSATKRRFITLSKESPRGPLIPAAVVAEALLVKFPCPNTETALSPFVILVVSKTSTRLFVLSATKRRLLVASNASPRGLFMPAAVRAEELLVKFVCPRTESARRSPGETNVLLPESVKTRTRSEERRVGKE